MEIVDRNNIAKECSDSSIRLYHLITGEFVNKITEKHNKSIT